MFSIVGRKWRLAKLDSNVLISWAESGGWQSSIRKRAALCLQSDLPSANRIAYRITTTHDLQTDLRSDSTKKKSEKDMTRDSEEPEIETGSILRKFLSSGG